MASPTRCRVFLDVIIGPEPAGRLTIELFTDKAPRTCENFRQLCANTDPNLSYAKSPFHRIIDEFMIQGGDITAGDGTGGKSIYNDGGEFEDENLDWRDMDAAGLVCMANRGKHTNSSQFFITLDECPHLNGKHTIFGHLVAGQDVLDKMAKVDVDDEDKPLTPVLVARSGELERKRKTAPISRVSPERVTSSADRGRRPSELENSLSLPTKERPALSDINDKRKRRQSDNHIDENLRGRPRARSDDGSTTTETAIESNHSRSPTSKHKRQRSPSPSRVLARGKGTSTHVDENHDHERRRRRSLPNQYDDQDHPRRDDERRDRHGGRRRSRSRDGNQDDRRGPRDWDDPRSHETRHDRNDNYRPRRQQDSYRPPRNNNNRDGRNGRLDDGRLNNDGRLGPGPDLPANDGGIKFKGRGSMKYREPDRRW